MEDKPDLGALIRLAGALDALGEMFDQLPSPPPPAESVPVAADMKRLYIQARAILGGPRAEELRLFVGVRNLELDEVHGFMARSTLAIFRGFIRGCVAELQAEAQKEANALAYAEAKVKEERGVGFKRRVKLP